MSGRAALAATALLALSGCQSAPVAGPGEVRLASSDPALSAMTRVTRAASRCWFSAGDAAFSAYRPAPELNSYTGRPRLLIVARDTPEGRPLAVVQGEGAPADIVVFGPLMTQPLGHRIADDVRRWVGGDTACAASA